MPLWKIVVGAGVSIPVGLLFSLLVSVVLVQIFNDPAFAFIGLGLLWLFIPLAFAIIGMIFWRQG
ncbi:MAG: hypothetical protein CMK07_01800 [Ponticaulis sp.]|nr:hypothetical protein [Ponticaulis sp.]